jgi:hypothetical protein
MCYWKQWCWVRTKIKHLLALAEPEDSNPAWRQQQEPLAHGRTALQQAPSNAC